MELRQPSGAEGGSYRSTWPAKSALIASLFAANCLWLALSDMSFDGPSALGAAGLVAVLAMTGAFYRVRRPNPRFEILCVETAFLVAFSATAAVTSYLVTSIGLPLIDGHLIAADRFLGFDWAAYVAKVNERPWLGQASSLLYMTTLSQVALAVISLGLAAPLRAAGRFVSAVMIGAGICIAVSGILPSAGALSAFSPPEAFYGVNLPIVDLAYKQTFHDLRSGALQVISLAEPKGLIAFPSYHCTLSVLLILAFLPFRYLRWPVAIVNVLVIMTTPIDGGHHLADALGGVAVALVAWRLSGVGLRGRFAAGSEQRVSLEHGV